VAIAFAAAHAAHANGTLGFAFVLAMAVQGAVWAVVRLRGRTIVPQILAHGALLALYDVPLPMALGVLALGALVFASGQGPSMVRSFADGARQG